MVDRRDDYKARTHVTPASGMPDQENRAMGDPATIEGGAGPSEEAARRRELAQDSERIESTSPESERLREGPERVPLPGDER